jgi:HSP20 family protein
MTDPHRPEEFNTAKERLDEIGKRLGSIFGQTKSSPAAAGGIFGGLGNLIEQLGKIAEQAEQNGGVVTKSGEFGSADAGKAKAVYGFTVKSGLGQKSEVKIEPFGNIRRDDTGKLVAVHEIREPLVDIFDEPTRLLIVAELPGIEEKQVQLDLQDDILIIAAEAGELKYRKEMLLSTSFGREQMSFRCRNGILEIELQKVGGV